MNSFTEVNYNFSFKTLFFAYFGSILAPQQLLTYGVIEIYNFLYINLSVSIISDFLVKLKNK